MAQAKAPYSKKELYRRGAQPTYRGRNLDEIAFPLGGIGTGMITLGGWGQLRDWEIRNRPAKDYAVRNGFFAIRIRQGRTDVTRVLQGPVEGSYTGQEGGGPFAGGGHGAGHRRGEGFPHFRKCAFRGEFPVAHLELSDPALPVRVTLEAFNPFIPLNDRDSSIPVAIFNYTVTNKSRKAVDVQLFGNLSNDVADMTGRVNEERCSAEAAGVYFTNAEVGENSPAFGSMAVAAMGGDLAVCPSHADNTVIALWNALADADKFPPKKTGAAATGTVAARLRLAAGESAAVPFLIAWHFPNFEHWQKKACCGEGAAAPVWKNWYASEWKDAWDVVEYVSANFERLREETLLFHDALFSSTLPADVLDAVSANISILKTPTCLRLTDGTFYGFEGCNNTSGCCEGSCTHVWNYAQALPYLFPALQRSQREAEYRHSMREDGYVEFRVPLPLGTKPGYDFHPCADGQMGAVMQVYREYLISGDRKWLESVWPLARRALEFAWKYWDADRDGVMEGMQHNTYDIEYYGPNTMMGSLYLGALRAAEEIAKILGDTDAAAEYRRLSEKGSKWTDKNLFNGQYYIQKVKPDAHKAWPDPQRSQAENRGMDERFPWPKHQVGDGCLSDQLLGQWYTEMLGLGTLYQRKNVRKALQSIFKYNWRKDLSDHPALFRLYAFGDEAGLIVCTWPRGGRPGTPSLYADEIWCGMEYQVASHLIYEGFVDEGLAIVKGARDRHRGDRRNPWDEFECGHHYARSMASYAVMLALAGFSCDMAEGRIGFAPRVFADNFRSFWSVGGAWGTYSQKTAKGKTACAVEVKYGRLSLKTLEVVAGRLRPRTVKASLNGKAVVADVTRAAGTLRIALAGGVEMVAGDMLTVAL